MNESLTKKVDSLVNCALFLFGLGFTSFFFFQFNSNSVLMKLTYFSSIVFFLISLDLIINFSKKMTRWFFLWIPYGIKIHCGFIIQVFMNFQAGTDEMDFLYNQKNLHFDLT